MSQKATLTLKDKAVELPVEIGSEGKCAVDISKLYSTTGCITLDDGYGNTGSTRSAVTFLDGEAGILRYRGYPVEILAERCDFTETAYLLIYGELPSSEQLEEFRRNIRVHTLLHEGMKADFRRLSAGCPSHGHP